MNRDKFSEDFQPEEDDIKLVESIVDNYKDKSEDEIFVEIIRLNNQMEEEMSFEEYESIFEKLNSIRHLLSEEQNSKLDRLLDSLKKDY